MFHIAGNREEPAAATAENQHELLEQSELERPEVVRDRIIAIAAESIRTDAAGDLRTTQTSGRGQ